MDTVGEQIRIFREAIKKLQQYSPDTEVCHTIQRENGFFDPAIKSCITFDVLDEEGEVELIVNPK